jgi:hypothetical protein
MLKPKKKTTDNCQEYEDWINPVAFPPTTGTDPAKCSWTAIGMQNPNKNLIKFFFFYEKKPS